MKSIKSKLKSVGQIEKLIIVFDKIVVVTTGYE